MGGIWGFCVSLREEEDRVEGRKVALVVVWATFSWSRGCGGVCVSEGELR